MNTGTPIAIKSKNPFIASKFYSRTTRDPHWHQHRIGWIIQNFPIEKKKIRRRTVVRVITRFDKKTHKIINKKEVQVGTSTEVYDLHTITIPYSRFIGVDINNIKLLDKQRLVTEWESDDIQSQYSTKSHHYYFPIKATEEGVWDESNRISNK
jgi:hypothetical protein